jgi:hypothetical protein
MSSSLQPIQTLSEVQCQKCGHQNFAAIMIMGPKVQYVCDQQKLDQCRATVLQEECGAPDADKELLRKLYNDQRITVTPSEVGGYVDEIREKYGIKQ